MWKVKCDCCGQIEDGCLGNPVLPNGWYSIKWKCEGRTRMGMDNPDHDEFILCITCMANWPGCIPKIRLPIRYAINNLETAHVLANGFGNNGNAAAAHIERALEYLGERMKT